MDGGDATDSQVSDEDDHRLDNEEASRRGMEKKQHGHQHGHDQVRDEEDAIGILPNSTRGCCSYSMEPEGGNDATENDGVEDASQPDARVDEVGVVEDQVEEEKTIDYAAQDSVVAVDVLVGGAECPGERVQGF